MPVLSTYSDWVDALSRFANGDDEILSEMTRGHFVIDAGTSQRFYVRAEEAYSKRKQKWLDKFNRLFAAQNILTAQDLGVILQNAKQNLFPICKFISVEALPANLRKVLQEDLDEFVAEIKKTLKETVSKNPDRRDDFFLMLNFFDLPKSETELWGFGQDLDRYKNCAPSQTGRKIIF